VKKVLVSYRDATAIEPYAAALRLVAVEPIPALPGSSHSSAQVSGVLLTGGEDVNPERYGEVPSPQTEVPDDERDTAELQLIAECLERDLPLFAICRGLQILNVQHGGTLIQHLSSVERHQCYNANRALPVHQVNIAPDTLLARIAETDRWQVNSRHHQAVARLGHGLVVSATDPEDGIIEALERPDKKFVLAVQWHPENQALAGPEQLKLFSRFAEALS